MHVTQENLKEMLVLPGHISEETFLKAVELAAFKKVPLTQVLIDEGYISDGNLGRTIADFFDYHFFDLQQAMIKDEYLTIFPDVVARAQRAIVFDITDDSIKIASEYVDNYEFFKLLEKKTSKKILVSYATAKGIDLALRFYKGNLHEKINTLVTSCLDDQEDGDIVKLVDLFLEYASDSRASDIHIEPLDRSEERRVGAECRSRWSPAP